MADVTLTRTLMLDVFDRAGEEFPQHLDGLSEQQILWRPAPEANPIGWIAWHVTRVQDDHMADLGGVPQAWTAKRPGGSWYERFALAYGVDEHGFGQTPEQVGAFHAEVANLVGYHADVTALSRRVLENLTDYERIVDENWDPPVTAGSRLVSVVDEVNQHLGQMAYVRGLLD